jgi:F-type H+-transporting ATPase subunit b
MKVSTSLAALLLLLAFVVTADPASAQEHQPARPTSESAAPQGAQPAHPPAGDHAEEETHEEGIMSSVFRFANFAILVGTVFYFLRTPIATHLASRSSQIRQDLVTAAEMRTAATAQLAEIEKKLQALPRELDALKQQGAEDVEAERVRIARAAADERTRLLEQTRREIDMRLRIAKRELTEHAARLAVDVAEVRIKRAITPEDQLRLVDRYASQLREAR